MPVVPQGSKILVTGASGFIAVHVVHEALKAGFEVVGTVRSDDKGDYLTELFSKQYPGKFSYKIAEDLEAPGAFDDAVKGVQGVLHTASPFHFNAEGKALQALVNPAVNGTKSVLKSIKDHGTEVKRVVITSSFAAILDTARTPPVNYTEADWNESAPAESAKLGDKQASLPAYRASKTLAERAAWDFVEKEKPQWDLSTINPPFVLGPILHQVNAPEKLNTSVSSIWNALHGSKSEKDLPGALGCVVDVRDVAIAHVRALQVPEAGGERFAVTIGQFTQQGIVDVIHEASWIPEELKKPVPVGKKGDYDVTQNNLSGAKAEKILSIKYHSFKSTIEGTVGSTLEYESRGWKGAPALPAVDIDLPPWLPPKQTNANDLEWAPLHTLDLSRIGGEDLTEVPEDVVKDVGQAFSQVGFIYCEGHGLSYGELLRQFAIGQYAFKNISEADKAKYKAKILQTGSFVGYKEAGHWKIGEVKDRIEQCNFGSTSFKPDVAARTFPADLQPLIPEILAFARFNHANVYRKILAVLSRVLKLPADFLWNLSMNPEEKGVDLLRYAMYHTPDKQDDEKLGGVRLQGHSDFNSVSILWSQPITSLEVLMPDDTWRLVKHKDNALVINLGDAMHFLSGSFFKPTIHRVVAPPQDQAHYTRLGVFYFALFNRDVSLKPLTEQSSVVREAYKGKSFWGQQIKEGKPIPTAGEWEQMRVKAYGQGAATKGEDGHEHETIAGHKVTHYNGLSVDQRRAAEQQQRKSVDQRKTIAAN